MEDFILSLKGLSSSEKGATFERVCLRILINHKDFIYDKAWLYNDIPSNIIKKLGLPTYDKGIDILAKKEGIYHAIQCKFRSSGKRIVYGDLATFSTQIKHCKKLHHKGIIMTNSDEVDEEYYTDDYEIIAGDFFDELGDEWFTNHESIITSTPKQLPQLLAHQIQAIEAAKKYYDEELDSSSEESDDDTFVNSYSSDESNYDTIDGICVNSCTNSCSTDEGIDGTCVNSCTNSCSTDEGIVERRAKIIAMCGTGKTRILGEICKNYAKVLILVPSLHLLSQVYHSLYHEQEIDRKYLPIGSDFDGVPEGLCISHVSIPGKTTDKHEITQFLEKYDSFIVICTYTSAINILMKIKYDYDFVAYDEAHHVAGVGKDANCNSLIDGIIGYKKLFLTATERISKINPSNDEDAEDIEIFSMDDKKKFGKCLMRYTLRDAIRDKRLSAYRIVCGITIPELLNYNLHNKSDEWYKFCVQILKRSIRRYALKRILTYHSDKKCAKDFKELLIIALNLEDGAINLLTGEDSMKKRKRIIKKFENHDGISIICSVRVLNEGVDIPCADSLMYVQPKGSTIDIIQSIGRITRLHTDKEKCTIIIPGLFTNNEEDTADDLECKKSFKKIMSVIRALQSQDEILADYIKFKHQINKTRDEYTKGYTEDDFDMVIMGDKNAYDIEELITNVEVSSITHLFRYDEAWDNTYEILLKFVETHNRIPIQKEKYKKVCIGAWRGTQRKNYKKGELSQERITKLNTINGWMWEDNKEERWDEWYSLVCEFLEKNGRLPYDKEKYKNKSIGNWCNNQKTNYKKGKLSQERITKLNTINGWMWDKEERWDESYNLVCKFLEKNGRLPHAKEKYKNVCIGSWCNNQRTTYKTGELSQERITKLNTIHGWMWKDDKEERWDESYNLVCEFLEKNGRLPHAKEKYKNKNIGMWCNDQRTTYKKGKLSQERITKLNTINGWMWKDDKEERWDESYNLVCKFLEKNGRLPIQKEKYKNMNIGNWCSTQKTNYKKCKLSQERTELLDSIPNWYW
jgi:superfamily II DNA or RNA helicase